MRHIPIAEAKKQIMRISNEVDRPLLLIGGLAVNQYVVTRNSEDIDLVCDHDTARRIIEKLYPTTQWRLTEINADEYRPLFYVEHKHNASFPIIKFGPKIMERGPYKYLNWENLETESIPFKATNQTTEKIRVPSLEALCYTKIVSFMSRDCEKKDKLEQDFRDLCELTNLDSFRLGIFLNSIVRNDFDKQLSGLFYERLSALNLSLDGSNLGNFIQLFSKSKSTVPEAEKSPCLIKRQPRSSLLESQRKIRLAAFDLDGTLIKGLRHSWTIVWNQLKIDSSAQKQRKEQFRKGKLSYLDWCRLDGADFVRYGLSTQHFKEIAKSNKLSLTKNLRRGISELKAEGIKTAIISGGIDRLLYELLPDADDLFDEILINRFVFSEDGLLKKISATEYDWDGSKVGVVGKGRGLERICEKYEIAIEDAAFIGDDLNDIEAMKMAGLKIFFCGDRREFTGGTHLPEEIVFIAENDLLEVVKSILNPPIDEPVD
ncbi:MAG: HAD-IB family phosphatase [Nitrospira sp.]